MLFKCCLSKIHCKDTQEIPARHTHALWVPSFISHLCAESFHLLPGSVSEKLKIYNLMLITCTFLINFNYSIIVILLLIKYNLYIKGCYKEML